MHKDIFGMAFTHKKASIVFLEEMINSINGLC